MEQVLTKTPDELSEKIYEDNRYRSWVVLFYKDTDTYDYNDVIFNIHSMKYYAYIKHQPETAEKNEHFHAFIHLDTACTLSSISKRLGVPPNYIQYVKNIRGACRYLTHIDYEEKIQYSTDDIVISPIYKRKFLKNFEDVKSEEEIIQDIYFFLDNNHYNTWVEKLRGLIYFININCYETVYKRYRYEFLEYLKENL